MKKTVIWVLVFLVFLVALTFVFDTSLKSIFYKAEKEITYQLDTSFYCVKKSISCGFLGELHLANTGRAYQRDIQVSLYEVPKFISTRVRILDLSSADHRESDPQYSISHEGFTRTISVSEIAPGTLMVISFSGLSISKDLKQKLDHLHVDVQHDGLTVEVDPRGTTVARILMRLFYFFAWW